MIKQKPAYSLLVLLLLSVTTTAQQLNVKYKHASVQTNGNTIIASTGNVQRVWRKTEHGLQTISLKLKNGKEWVNTKLPVCDWEYGNGIIASTKATLVSLTAKQNNDSGFAKEHLEMIAEYVYESINLHIQYHVRLYPNSNGIFTQLYIKGDSSKLQNTSVNYSNASGRVEFIPVNAKKQKRFYFGYFNDTQHRNTDSTPLLKEQVIETAFTSPEIINWANGMCVQGGKNGLLVIKESHKCVNQFGHDTGEFICTEDGIASTGTSLLKHEILPTQYRKAWASWVVLFEGGNDERELALKIFERERYPVNPKTDVYIIANTWGSDRQRSAATEQNVRKEMTIQKELGIDVQQIDDGYQMYAGEKGFDPTPRGWYPVREKFPNGFLPIRKKADELNMKTGLWFASMKVSTEEMKKNYDTAGFSFYKLDFANLRNHASLEMMEQKIRAFELHSKHQAKVNWDVTENNARFGYFWAKEYGGVFLENRKPKFPTNVVYIPYLVLRDLWHLAKYCNLNKFQGSVQNIDKVDTASSDAYLYNHRYSVAVPLMSTPLFFQETQFYSNEAKQQVKTVLDAYRKVRYSMYESIVYPVGSEPNNKSWTGFQAHHPQRKEGYITLFRERLNTETKKSIRLKFLPNKKITVTDLMTNQTFTKSTNVNGEAEFEITNAADFRFYKYTWQ
ncbi:hypothetical protein [Lacibacter sp.]|uniref:hypothetical protein n=1 Tax=Lacibacter sp. TaxID=1915409 RepID=UPI002B4AAE59|nr:hypothetical protein [Lacibacter sp.]HLP37694.1 hypothetical protein [Lacibacter sp.]